MFFCGYSFSISSIFSFPITNNTLIRSMSIFSQSFDDAALSSTTELSWYCLRSKPRQESIASHLLRTNLGLEVFSPRIRFKRARATGIAWVNEALFPGYLFAQFNYLKRYRQIASIRGIMMIVAFGGRPTTVSDTMIADLRLHVSDQEILEITNMITAGDEVNIVAGP